MRISTGLVVLALAGCGAGGDDGGGTAIDAAPDDSGSGPDAEPADAMPPPATRAATLLIADVNLTSTQAAAVGLRGGAVSFGFADLTSNGGEVVYAQNGCVVTRFDATHQPSPVVDAGDVALGGNGFLKTIGSCHFEGTFGYVCEAKSGSAVAVTAIGGGNGTVTYSFTGQSFAGQDLVGGHLRITGFSAPDADYNAPVGHPFAIVSQTTTSMVVRNEAGADNGVSTTGASTAYTVLAGAGAVPTLGTGSAADADFLGDETTVITVTKAGDPDWPAIDITMFPRAERFILANASARPHEFPTTAADMSFTCTGTGGLCGTDPVTLPAGVFEAMMVTGRTTNGAVSSLADHAMPSPTGSYTTFQCTLAEPTADAITLPAAAITAILNTSPAPTRIETSVLRVAGATLDGPTAADLGLGKILVGHAVIGHTTP